MTGSLHTVKHTIYFLLILSLVGCGNYQPPEGKNTQVSHQIWDRQLKTFVNDEGWVDYKGWQKEHDKLKEYLRLLSENPPDETAWTREQQLAYWINAYNAFTIDLILTHYPLESITDLHPTVYIPGVNTVWHKKFFEIGNQPTSLDEIEHKILRVKFEEPRIHFAINCASYSCPALRGEAYVANRIDRQLEEQAINFINDPKKNQLQSSPIKVSRIFQWFTKDFTKGQSLIQFLNRYSQVKIEQDAKIDYMKYDWSLNGQ